MIFSRLQISKKVVELFHIITVVFSVKFQRYFGENLLRQISDKFLAISAHMFEVHCDVDNWMPDLREILSG